MGDDEIHQGIYSRAKFTRRKSLRRNSLERIFKGWRGAIFLTSSTTKYILDKIPYFEKHILYKVAQADIIYNINSSLGGQSIYYKK